MSDSTIHLRPLGPIEVSGVIGVGGHATVHAGRTADGRLVAVKRLLAPFADDGERNRFERECRLLAELADLDGVVELLASGTIDGRGHLVTARYDGTLADRVGSLGPLDPGEVVSIARSVAVTLADVHRRGIVHRDIKPSNLFLGPDGVPVLGDFGIAHDIAERTVTGGAALSFAYAAPETLESGETGPQADLYAFGASLHHLLTGAPPFAPPTGSGPAGIGAFVRRVADEPPPAIDRGDLPASLAALVADLLSKAPGDRPKGADAVVARLAPDALAGVAPAPATGRRSRRRIVASVGVVAATAGVFALSGRGGTDPDSTPFTAHSVAAGTDGSSASAPTTIEPAPASVGTRAASTTPTTTPPIGTANPVVIDTGTVPTSAPVTAAPAATTPVTDAPSSPTTVPAPTTEPPPPTNDPTLTCAPEAVLCASFESGTAGWFGVVDSTVAALTAPSAISDDGIAGLAIVPSGGATEGGSYLRRTVTVPAQADTVTMSALVRFDGAGSGDWFANVLGVRDEADGAWNVDARPQAGAIQLSGYHETSGSAVFVAADPAAVRAWVCVELTLRRGSTRPVAITVDGSRYEPAEPSGSSAGLIGSSLSVTVGPQWLSPADAAPTFEIADLTVHTGGQLGCG